MKFRCVIELKDFQYGPKCKSQLVDALRRTAKEIEDSPVHEVYPVDSGTIRAETQHRIGNWHIEE